MEKKIYKNKIKIQNLPKYSQRKSLKAQKANLPNKLHRSNTSPSLIKLSDNDKKDCPVEEKSKINKSPAVGNKYDINGND